jgi:hypothetical protein
MLIACHKISPDGGKIPMKIMMKWFEYQARFDAIINIFSHLCKKHPWSNPDLTCHDLIHKV